MQMQQIKKHEQIDLYWIGPTTFNVLFIDITVLYLELCSNAIRKQSSLYSVFT